jgi:hypothetical protein
MAAELVWGVHAVAMHRPYQSCYPLPHHHNQTGDRMSEIDDISARLTVLETVVRQLITHMAIHADDPAQWVETRRVLVLSALQEDGGSRLREAVAGFFDPAAHVADAYSLRGTHRSPGR